MNLDQNPTVDQLKGLVASVDDNAASHIIYVDKAGNVKIAAIDENSTAPVDWIDAHEDEVQFRKETLVRGNDWVGPEAASDDAYMKSLFEDLVENWNNKSEGYVD